MQDFITTAFNLEIFELEAEKSDEFVNSAIGIDEQTAMDIEQKKIMKQNTQLELSKTSEPLTTY